MNVNDIMLERIKEIQDHLCRLKEFVINNSHYIDESTREALIKELNDEFYSEAAEEKKSVLSHAATIVEHLLKLKYCTNNRSYDVWINTVESCQSDIVSKMHYPFDTNANLLNHLLDNIDAVYRWGVGQYDTAMRKYDDLVGNRGCIPDTVPWNVDDLIVGSIEHLVMKLPDPAALPTQMQLRKMCIYYHDHSAIRGIPCSECRKYADCVHDYYEHRRNRNGIPTDQNDLGEPKP